MNYRHEVADEHFRHTLALDDIAARYRVWLGALSNADLGILSQAFDPSHPEGLAVKWEIRSRMARIISERKAETEKNVA